MWYFYHSKLKRSTVWKSQDSHIADVQKKYKPSRTDKEYFFASVRYRTAAAMDPATL